MVSLYSNFFVYGYAFVDSSRMYFNTLTEYVGMPRQERYLKRLAAKT